MAVVTSGALSGGAVTQYIADELLMIAKKNVIFQQLGERAKLPPGSGKNFQFNRYERLSLPQTTLVEGVPPSSTSLALTTVSAVADQWGAFIALSDVAQLTIKHPLLSVAIELLGYQAAELVEREIINVLLAGTSVVYGGTQTLRSGLATVGTDSFSDNVVQRAVSTLRANGAYPYESQNFVGVIDPLMEQDITASTNSTFVTASAYNNVKQLYNGEIGMWRGVRWMTSNLIPSLTGLAAGSYTATGSDGSFAGANYRITTAYYDINTGFLVQLTQNSVVAVSSTNHIAYTAPSNTAYTYRVFIGLAAGGATAAMFQASESTVGLGAIAAGASAVFLAPPVSGTAIAGSGIPGTGLIVHIGWILGKQAFCVVDLMNLQTFVSAPNATVSDPLVQQRTVGYKLMFKAVIQNNNFMERIEVLSAFG